MEFNVIMPLQALRNNQREKQRNTQGRQAPDGSFAALLGSYTQAETAVKRQDGFGGHQTAFANMGRPLQSEMDLLWRQVRRVNNVISALIDE